MIQKVVSTVIKQTLKRPIDEILFNECILVRKNRDSEQMEKY